MTIDDLHWKRSSNKEFRNVEADWTSFDRIINWMQNFEINLSTIIHSVTKLPKINGSALIIDKSMASTNYFKQLPQLQKYKGTIICCDRALYTLIPHRLPNYVCNLDASPLCINFFDRPDVKEIMDEVIAVFSVTTNPLTIRHWHGNRVFFTPGLLNFGLTKRMMEQTKTPFMQTGGQVASFAYLLAYNLGANPIGLFGITHSYDKRSEAELPRAKLKKKKGPHGIVWQDQMYESYNETFLKFIEALTKKNVSTINTMQNGLLYSKYVVDMSLREFIHIEGESSSD